MASSPPAGAATVDTLLRARLPAVPVTGTYTFTFVDRCAVVETTLVAVVLEEAPMIIVPQDADLNGAFGSFFPLGRRYAEPMYFA